jgi:hypothetical protein
VLDPANTLGFTLTVPHGKKAPLSWHLTAPNGVRDLIYLAAQVFGDPSALDRLTVAPSSSATLHLSAMGSITPAKPEGGGASPASSMTSEQQSLAEVDEAAKAGGAGPSTSARKSSSLVGRTLSFRSGSKKNK